MEAMAAMPDAVEGCAKILPSEIRCAGPRCRHDGVPHLIYMPLYRY